VSTETEEEHVKPVR